MLTKLSPILKSNAGYNVFLLGMMLERYFMMQKRVTVYFSVFFILFLMSCAATSKLNKPVPPEPVERIEPKGESYFTKQQELVAKAKSFLGSPYRYGGTDKNGFDCSGLVFCSFQSIGINLPRSSKNQAGAGVEISKKQLQAGDVIFFAQPGGQISHSGIVEKIVNGNVLFIHSSSSQGVIISSLEQQYWKQRFVKGVRLLD